MLSAHGDEGLMRHVNAGISRNGILTCVEACRKCRLRHRSIWGPAESDLMLGAHGDEVVHACAAFLTLTPFNNRPHELTACMHVHCRPA